MLNTDYLIIGAGAVGLAFADQLLTDSDATIAIVDRRPTVGGHWNDAYPFVRLHQPSVYYGVGSRGLGDREIDTEGLNAGNYRLATGEEIRGYFQQVMQERLLPSGRVTYFPNCEVVAGPRIASLASGATHGVHVRRKVVDTTYFDVRTPCDHVPSFSVSPAVRLTTPKDLPAAAPPAGRYVVLGGGKTAMDTIVWLIEAGVEPGRIRWVVPRDAWLINRDVVQPGDQFFERTAEGQARRLEAAASASSLQDLFGRLERCGELLRVDLSVRPTMYRGATSSPGEIRLLRKVKDVVRKGRVLRLGPQAMALEHGWEDATPDDLHVDCTATGLARRPPIPVFRGGRITVQAVRANVVCFSAAFIAHVEAGYDNEDLKNDLCAPIPVAERDADWPGLMLADLRNARRWAADRPLRQWVTEHRLTGNFITPGAPRAPIETAQALARRIAAARGPAEVNLARLATALAVQGAGEDSPLAWTERFQADAIWPRSAE